MLNRDSTPRAENGYQNYGSFTAPAAGSPVGEEEDEAPRLPQNAALNSPIQRSNTVREPFISSSKGISWIKTGSNQSSNILNFHNEEIELQVENEAQQKFFDFLEHELQKIDQFYTEREREAGKRLFELRMQLQEMTDLKKQVCSKS